jgi:hypothetical protein
MVNEDEKATGQAEVWKEVLSHHDWYVKLEDFLRNEIFSYEHDPEILKKRHQFYGLVEEMLKNGQIPLAQEGPDLDAERQPVDTVVIHHTEENPNISLDRLNAIGLVRQFAQKYLDDDLYGHKGVRGQPIWSGHFRDGKQVFFAYHWLVRPDGTTERLLDDKYVGRHALEINPRSVGIAFSGNYEHSTPPLEQIQAAAKTIKNNYSYVDSGRILGHREVMENRTCPGDKFLPQWKQVLLDAVKR